MGLVRAVAEGVPWVCGVLAGFLLTFAQFGFIFGLFRFVAFFGARFQHRFGLGQIGQPLFSDGNLVLDDQPFRQLHFALINLFTQLEQFADFLPQLGFDLDQTLVAHRFALGRIRMDLAAIQTDIPQFQHPRRLRQQQDLHKQIP